MKLALFSLVLSASLFADFGGKELQGCVEEAMEGFSKNRTAMLSAYDLKVSLKASKRSADVVLSYKDGEELKALSCNCHAHGDHLHCGND